MLPSIQTAFGQFQKQNQFKNLSHDAVEIYSAKASCFSNLPLSSVQSALGAGALLFPPKIKHKKK